MTPGQNGKPDADRIADYLEGKAERFKNWAAKTGNVDLRSHATAHGCLRTDHAPR